jgi:antitoxin (DNA-binding transcriptional repressor) of toxin-antitoxin stability system
MKTATIQQVPQQWAQILRWLASDEEVQVTQDERIIARILPSSQSSTTGPKPKDTFWDANTTALLKHSSHFRLGDMPSREERNER